MAINSDKNTLKKYISENGHVRAGYVEMTEVVREACSAQGTNLSASIALGRVMIGAVLMSSQLKNDQQVAIHFKCSGPLKTLYAQSSYEGKVRAYVGNPHPPDMILQNQISLGPLVGDGQLTVSTYIPNSEQPQNSFMEIVSGEVAEDLVHYMNQSMQIPCIISLGVHLDSHGQVDIASGLIIQLMPGHTEGDISKIEDDFKKAPILSQILKTTQNSAEIVDIFLKDFKMKSLEHPFTVQYYCTCSQDRVKSSMKLLTEEDWQEIFAENKSVDVNCQMCGKKFILEIPELLKLYEGLDSKKLH